MAGLAFKKIIELFLSRIIFLFLATAVLFFVLVDHHALKVKTLNFLRPDEDVRQFAEHPGSMSREKLTNLKIYYKTVCEFVTNDPEEPAPCSIAGYANYYLGNEKKAIHYYERAARLNDRFFWFHFNLGVIHYNQERYKEAAENFARALDVPKDHAKYFFMLTKTYREIAKLLDLTEQDYENSFRSGYELAKKLYVISNLFSQQPELQKGMQRQKIELHLF